jgi:hypothetical protein
MEFTAIVAIVAAVNLGAVAVGYYIGLGHIDRMLDIEEDSSEAPFPPDFNARESERLGPLSPEEIDEIDDWDRRE